MLGKKKDNKQNNHDSDKNDRSSTSEDEIQREHHKSSSNKGTNFIPNEVKYILIGIALVAIVWLGLRFLLQTNNPFYVVSSESMIPTLMVGDLVVLRNGADGSGFSFSDLQIGDIIIFHSEDGGGRTIVHRIVEIYQEAEEPDTDIQRTAEVGEEERLVKTKGDNNPVSYEGLDYPIRETDYYGKVISIIPEVGLVTLPPYNYIIAGIAAGLASVTGILTYIINHQKNNNSRSKKNKE